MKIQITKEPRPEGDSRRGASFVNRLIALCLTMCMIVTLSVVFEYHRLNTVLGAGEITSLLAVWGGELLLIVVRQVLGSDITKKNKEDSGE